MFPLEQKEFSMNFKDIAVHMNNPQLCRARLDVAIKLAKEYDAHLTGIYVITHPHYAPDTGSMKRQEAEAEEMFRQKTSEAGISAEWSSADWATVGVDMVEVLNHYAHQKDLIIVGQTDRSLREGDIPKDLPERVVLGSG